MDHTAYRHESSVDSESLGDETETEDDDDEIALANLSETAFLVYHNVWQEFYNWEQAFCRNTLSSLHKPVVKSDPLPEPIGQFFINPHSRSEWFQIEDLDDVESRVTITHVASREPVQLAPVKPYPKYSACTPASENLLAVPNIDINAQFFHFSDNERFEKEVPSYLGDFEKFMWQTDFADPDLEMIQIEAARRLHYGHEITFKDINSVHIFAFPLSKTNRSGLIWWSQQRDPLFWPGAQMSALDKLPSNFVNPNFSLEENVVKDLYEFCGRPNCLKSCCRLHNFREPYRHPKPSLNNTLLRNDGRPSCGENCFKTINFDYLNKENYHWEDADQELFKSVFHLTPNTSPCDLSAICRKPCFEMYIERSKLLNLMEENDMPTSLAGQGEDNSRIDIIFEEDIDSNHTQVAGPCDHQGTCYTARCVCYASKQRCERGCSCPESYGKAANVPVLKDHVPQNKVVLVKKLRGNVTPFFVRGARPGFSNRRCWNTDLQKGRFVSLRISEAKYGLGAYATSDLPFGKYIGEYVGEFYSQKTLNWTGQLHKFTNLNYAFGIHAEEEALDSWFIGNETRYLNHSEDSNCLAEILLVNGDQRIVLITTRDIKAGEELFLDYGENYWNSHK